GRVHRGRDAGGQPLSPRAGGGCGAVPLDPARPVLPRRGHDAQPARDRRAALLRRRHGAGADRRQGRHHHGAGPVVRHAAAPGLCAGRAAQPGRRVRFRAVRPGPVGHADRGRGGEHLRCDRHAVGGPHAGPDDGHPEAAHRTGAARAGSRH
ncbi:hypothetical protein QU38_01840, partial [Staphylococcus aureus]